jgi:acetylornithine deacetylase/succinyl-diaminopimelate desuccinylase-like protein
MSALRPAVERALPDAVSFLQELVRVPSLLGNEEPAQRLVEERLLELGFEVRSVDRRRSPPCSPC